MIPTENVLQCDCGDNFESCVEGALTVTARWLAAFSLFQSYFCFNYIHWSFLTLSANGRKLPAVGESTCAHVEQPGPVLKQTAAGAGEDQP